MLPYQIDQVPRRVHDRNSGWGFAIARRQYLFRKRVAELVYHKPGAPP